MRINIDRLMADIDALAQIGRTTDGGVTRVAMSENDVLGRTWFREQVEAAGLEFHADGAGNLSAVLDFGSKESILMGSHLDSVPNGGRFDGALGVLSALEVLRTIREAGVHRTFNLEAISFTDEEGGVFSMLGSRAVSGTLTVADLTDLANQVQFDTGLQRLEITPEGIVNAARDDIRAFVEVHIEQGTRLEAQQIDIGIVPSIVGIRNFRLHFYGEAAHAGTTPMDKRSDALWAVAEFIQRARQVTMEDFAPGVMNIGQLEIPNSATNIVPAQVSLSLEFRHGDDALLDRMESTLLRLARDLAKRQQLGLNVEAVSHIAPAAMSATVINALESAADALGLSHTSLFSFAGHDSQTMAMRFPTGLFFVPSVGGISHNPKELSLPSHVENAGNVLLHAVIDFTENHSDG